MPRVVLPRRTFLRGVMGGAAVTIALPYLEAMNPVARAAPAPPRRFGVWFFGNGVRREHWVPQGEGTAWRAGEELAPLEPLRGAVSVLSGFEMKVQPFHPHHAGMAGILTGETFQKVGNVRDTIVSTFAHPSIDQVAASTIGGKTRLRSLEVGVCQFRGTDEGTTFEHVSHNGPNNPNPAEYAPGRLYQRLFGAQPPAAVTAARRSALDLVRGQVESLRLKVSAHDQRRLDQHLTSLRALEKQLADSGASCQPPGAAPGSVPDVMGQEQIEQKNRLMSDLLVAALACDLTRVFTVTFSTCGSGVLVWQAGATDGLHYTCHTEANPQPIVHRATVFTMQQFAYLLKKLKETPEQGGNLLDQCAILCTTEHSEGNTHSIDEFPILVAGGAGGKLKGGIHYRSKTKENTSKVLLTLLRAVGCELSEFGYNQGRTTETVAAIGG